MNPLNACWLDRKDCGESPPGEKYELPPNSPGDPPEGTFVCMLRPVAYAGSGTGNLGGGTLPAMFADRRLVFEAFRLTLKFEPSRLASVGAVASSSSYSSSCKYGFFDGFSSDVNSVSEVNVVPDTLALSSCLPFRLCTASRHLPIESGFGNLMTKFSTAGSPFQYI